MPPESVDAFADCLMPHPASLGSRAAGFRSWLMGLAEGWVQAGFTAPDPTAAENREGPPDPAAVDPEAINLVRATHLEDLREAADWASGTRFLGAERRAALGLLTDVFAVGAAPTLPAFLSAGQSEAILDSFPGTAAPPATLWRSAAGRDSTGLWPAILWNRVVGDPQELHSGPECIAAAVAVAEVGDRTLGELLDAIIVACGVGNWHRDAVGAAMEASGIHSPGALAPVATAAAVGRLKGIGARNLAQSLRRASALTPIHPYRAFAEGKGVKLFYGAFGQLLGAAATLSIKNPIGLLPAPSLSRRSRGEGVPPFDPRVATRAIHAISLKKFPGSRAVQSVLAAIEKLPRIEPDAIESITVETYPFSATVSGWARPDAGPIAMHSHIPTAVALMMEARNRRIPFEASLYPRFRGPTTVALAERVVVRVREFGDSDAPPSRRTRWARVTIRPKSGPDLTASSGPPFTPPPLGAIRDRFARMTRESTVRDPHQFPYSAPVRSLFQGAAAEPRPASPGVTVLPQSEPRATDQAAAEPRPKTTTLFGKT